jgi:DNA-binding NarL/FixJ family response regulator
MTSVDTTKILIVEDHPLYARGLVSIIESVSSYVITGIAGTIDSAQKIAENEKPDMVTLDLKLGQENGMDLIPWFKNINPDIVILVVSMYDERYYSERILRLGARGYIMKNQDADTVLEAIKVVLSGKVYLSEPERERIFDAMTGDTSNSAKDWTVSIRKLSDRELQIFNLIGKGLGTIEIASKFQISTKTIDTHKEHIKLKLHCGTSQELRQLAIEWASFSGLP